MLRRFSAGSQRATPFPGVGLDEEAPDSLDLFEHVRH
jgi:hypothetical protein